ncbi:permease-like cell division protein FtsX [Patescibacteria group bacterium]|nr:permease-like cell division protein FtsX [Patescibacteria group bacterium]MBU4453301.1 permease-like cell division protein FtsX [Patescibacteria group bacterium]MCG2687870.1 permease-like cell division protein FtsX [Candidatus Parcubacteria bacterium]
MSITLSIARMVKFTSQNVFRNFWLSFITSTIFVLTLITINAVLFMNVVADSVLETVGQKVEVTFYFLPNATEDIVASAQGYLRGFSQVRDVQFVSKEDALNSFTQRYQNDEVILSSLSELGENPFGHSLVVSTYSTEDFGFIVDAMETPEFSSYIKEHDFTDYQQVIEKIELLNKRIRYAGFCFAALFGLIAIMIIFNTIRVAIYVHRDEIAIMKLVGANDWFIRGPFILEALLYSLLSTLAIVIIIFVALGASHVQMIGFFGDAGEQIIQYFKDNAIIIFGLEFAGLAMLSLLTTAFAMRKYLKI